MAFLRSIRIAAGSFLLIAGLVLAPIRAHAAETSPAVQAVLAAEKDLVAALVNRDQAALEKLLADDLHYVHGDAGIHTKPVFIRYALHPGMHTSIDFQDTTVRELGGVVVVGHKTLIREKDFPQGILLYVTFVWEQRDGRWQLVYRQGTTYPRSQWPAGH